MVWRIALLFDLWLAYSATAYVIDDSGGLGRRFDGIGAISGGGATSRLLVNYPEPQRSQILDFLFKPNYGAALHILKVEIGGDSQSSEGTEASHMHDSWDENYRRGYEWWMMAEAKKRNNDILLYGLPWAFPGWVGAGTDSPYTNTTLSAEYIVRWIKGAKIYYNLTIDYVGIWNEKRYSVDYILTLRNMLDLNGLQSTRIVASDSNGVFANRWAVAGDILKNDSLARAVDVIGAHYPSTETTSMAVQTGKPLWSSEDNLNCDDPAESCATAKLNLNYVHGLITGTISWPLLAAFYPGLPFPRSGMMVAEEPWSGNYYVKPQVWLTAHTTQFVVPGWIYLKHGSGVGKLDSGGTYVSMTDGKGELTIVVETLSQGESTHSKGNLYQSTVQNVTFHLQGNCSSIKMLNVTHSKLPDPLFQAMEPLAVEDGKVFLQIGYHEVFTLSTLPPGQRGSSPPVPDPKPFPLPYEENFESYPENGEPNNFAQQVGSFEVVYSPDTNRSKVLRQVVLADPIDWCIAINLASPMNVIGNSEWTDTVIEVDARIGDVNGSDSVFLASRVDQGGCQAFATKGFFFFLFPAQKMYELANDLSRTISLQKGPAQTNPTWNRIGLTTQNNTVSGYLNGKILFNVQTSGLPSHGFAAIGSGSFGISEFDNFRIALQNH